MRHRGNRKSITTDNSWLDRWRGHFEPFRTVPMQNKLLDYFGCAIFIGADGPDVVRSQRGYTG